MKRRTSWRLRAAVFALVALCLGTGAAATAGGEGDPLVTLSYLNQTVLPNLLKQTEEQAAAKQQELTEAFRQQLDQQGGGQTGGATYSVVTLSPGQTVKMAVGCEVMLRIGTATVQAKYSPALVDMTTGGTLETGAALEKNHLYLATIADHSLVAGNTTTKVLIRGNYTLS